MGERSECSRWLNKYNHFPVSLEINFNSKYIAPLDHKEQFAVCTSINSLIIKKGNRYIHVCVLLFLLFGVIYVVDVIKTFK